MTFAEALKKVRRDKRLSKYRLAKECGVSWLTVNDWEKGRKLPSFPNTIKLFRLFPELMDLLGGDGDGKARKKR